MTHRIEKLSCIENSVTQYQVCALCLSRGIVKNDELKWSRRHTIDTIPDDWRHKTDVWNEMEQKKTATCCWRCSRIHRSKQFIKTENLFAFRAVAFLCSSCAFHNSNPSKNRRRNKNYRQTYIDEIGDEKEEGKKYEENLLWISWCMCGKAENEMLTQADLWMGRERERAKKTRFLLDKRWRQRIPFQEM